MEVSKGYKQTEVGIIPEDWNVKQLKDVVSKVIDNRGKTPPYKDIEDVELIETASISFVNQYPDYSKITKFVSDETYKNWFRGHPAKNDVLISTVGEYSGASAMMEENRGTIAQNLIALRIKEVMSAYVFYWTRSGNFKTQLDQVMMSQAQPSLRVPWLLNFYLNIPPTLAEQEAIAEALSDADALIEAVEQLLTKKRQVKQGAMSELLTGKRRLPGFSGEWKTKKLGEITEIISGGTPSTRIDEYWNGNINWCTPTDITGTSGKYLDSTEKQITELGLKNSSANLLPKGTLLLCTRATIGEVKIATDVICTNQGFKSLICSNQVNNEFLYYVLLTLKPKLIEKAIGSTFLEITKKQTALIEISIPSIAEQTAIAEILSDMDAEITALEGKLVKARQVKVGMMSVLLTGKVRLV
jgi:type I restriction enzyme S subunit